MQKLLLALYGLINLFLLPFLVYKSTVKYDQFWPMFLCVLGSFCLSSLAFSALFERDKDGQDNSGFLLGTCIFIVILLPWYISFLYLLVSLFFLYLSVSNEIRLEIKRKISQKFYNKQKQKEEKRTHSAWNNNKESQKQENNYYQQRNNSAMNNFDPYNILGLERNASRDEIKKMYRKLAHIYHPDKGGNRKKFEEINRAYNILMDSL